MLGGDRVSRAPLLMHCQHSVGLGHLVRTLGLAGALAEAFEVTLLCGGRLPRDLALPADVEIVELPPLDLDLAAGAALASPTPGLGVEAALAARSAVIDETFRRVAPRVLVIELFPFGRKKLAGELLPLLRRARALGPQAPLAVCSVRDILVRSRHDQERHDERASRIANTLLDAVLVHADPRLACLGDSFAPRTPLAVPVVHTGLVRRPSTDEIAGRGGIVVSAGGGREGAPLLRAALGAQRILRPRLGLPMTLVTGPFLDPATHADLASAAAEEPELEIEVVRSVPDLRPLLRAADVSVSQCGYNTALELLETGVRALVVPFAEGREDEQTRRAERLRALGAVDLLPAAALGPDTLAAAIEARLARPSTVPDLDVDGAARSVKAIQALLEGRRPVEAAV